MKAILRGSGERSAAAGLGLCYESSAPRAYAMDPGTTTVLWCPTGSPLAVPQMLVAATSLSRSSAEGAVESHLVQGTLQNCELLIVEALGEQLRNAAQMDGHGLP